MLRVQVFGAAALAAALCLAMLPNGFVGPLSARVRGLFIKHTKTGNPLVDSVAEHQATPAHVYWHYFHCTCLLAPLGWGTLRGRNRRQAASHTAPCFPQAKGALRLARWRAPSRLPQGSSSPGPCPCLPARGAAPARGLAASAHT